MTQPKSPDVGLLDRDRAHRIMMQLSSQQLLERLTLYHPRIVRLLQERQGIEAE